jgi:hypothetical protein
MRFSGLSPDGRLVEIAELVDHPFMLGTQFHPEFLSRPNRPAPLICPLPSGSLRALWLARCKKMPGSLSQPVYIGCVSDCRLIEVFVWRSAIKKHQRNSPQPEKLWQEITKSYYTYSEIHYTFRYIISVLFAENFGEEEYTWTQ